MEPGLLVAAQAAMLWSGDAVELPAERGDAVVGSGGQIAAHT